jgi:hypothetical protein
MFKFLIVSTVLIGLNLNHIEANSFIFGSCAKSPVIADFDITKVNYYKYYFIFYYFNNFK